MTTPFFKRASQPLIAALFVSGVMLTGCSNDNPDVADMDTDTDVVTSQDTALTDNDAALVDDDTAIVTPDAQTKQTDDAPAPADVMADDRDKKTDTAAPVVDKSISPIAAAVKEPSLVTNPTEKGTPEDTVKKALDTLYYGDATKAASYYAVDIKNFAEELENTQYAFKQTVERVTITDTTYNADKSRATVVGELMLKDQGAPAPLTYELKKVDGKWKILG